MIDVAPHAQGSVLRVRAHPGARKNSVIGEHAGALRVAVSAPPARGKANAALAHVLADALGCKSSDIQLLSGETAREKRFLVAGLAAEALRARLEELLKDHPRR
jgi:uncharacterized protein (TIGR00251 family)